LPVLQLARPRHDLLASNIRLRAASSDLRQFRIVEIGELENPDLELVHGVWIVEPVEE
jgi:hypothetical protein